MKPKMSRSEKTAYNKAEKRIDLAYRKKCSGIAINMLDIPKVFRFGHELIAKGADDVTLETELALFVNSIQVAK
jgi:hypothetical protein